MAKSRRGRGRKSRRQVDWVVNEWTYDMVPYIIDNGDQFNAPLTIPEFVAAYADPSFSVAYNRGQWPEQDSGQVAYAVRGHIECLLAGWASGSRARFGFRIVKAPMEWGAGLTGAAMLDPQYTLYSSVFANERFLWETKQLEDGQFGASLGPTVLTVNWKGVVKLEPNEALWLIGENATGSVQRVEVRPFLRTLMRANG